MFKFCCLSVFVLMTVSCGDILLGQGDFFDDADQRIEQHRKTDIAIEVLDSNGQTISGATVNVEMKNHQFRWGTAAVASRINSSSQDNQIYKQKLLENFNSVVFENDLKWPAWEGAWGSNFGWGQAEQALDWLDSNGLPTRGHYASWGTLNGPSGYGPGHSDTEGLRERLFEHITDKLSTVGNRVTEWDVINHPIGWGPETYDDVLGPDIYADIVKHARSVAPQGMEMWVNEDNILNGTNVSDDYEDFIQDLSSKDATPDGIGFQGHFKSSWGRNQSDTAENIYNQMERFSNLVPRLQITEFDIDVGQYDSEGNLVSYDEAEHARLMHDYLTAAFSHEDLEGITMWGFWEDAHWLSTAALFNSDWSEREALTAYRDLVFDEWWTDEVGLTDENGLLQLRGFKGDYEITVEFEGETYTQRFNTDSSSLQFVVGVPEPSAVMLLTMLFTATLAQRRRA